MFTSFHKLAEGVENSECFAIFSDVYIFFLKESQLKDINTLC